MDIIKNKQNPYWILVTSAPRSATTALAQNLAHDTNTAVLYEPLNAVAGQSNVQHYFQYTGNNSAETQAIWQSIQTLRVPYKKQPFAADWGVRRWGKQLLGGRGLWSQRWVRYAPFCQRIICKDPFAVFLARHLCLTQGLPVVVPVRPPLAVAASFKKRGWLFDLTAARKTLEPMLLAALPHTVTQQPDWWARLNSTPALQAAALWAISTYALFAEDAFDSCGVGVAQAVLRRAPLPLWVVDQRAVLKNPIAVYKTLYTQLHIPWSDYCACRMRTDYLQNHDDASDYHNASNKAWKTILTDDEQSSIYSIVAAMLESLSRRLEWANWANDWQQQPQPYQAPVHASVPDPAPDPEPVPEPAIDTKTDGLDTCTTSVAEGGKRLVGALPTPPAHAAISAPHISAIPFVPQGLNTDPPPATLAANTSPATVPTAEPNGYGLPRLIRQRTCLPPGFLYIGPPKAASTWLYRFLANHQAVYVPAIKDLYFFDRYYDRGLAWYLKHFYVDPQSTDHTALISGELSHDYLYSKAAAQRSAHDLPHVKILSILRNPLERAISEYYFLMRSGLPPMDFQQAIEKYPSIVRKSLYSRGFGYWLHSHHRERIHCLLYDDLCADAARFARHICTLLRIPWCDNSHINERINSAALPRARILAQSARFAANGLRALRQESLLGAFKHNAVVRRLFYNAAGVGAKRPITLSRACFDLLQHEFNNDSETLERMLGQALPSLMVHSPPQHVRIV